MARSWLLGARTRMQPATLRHAVQLASVLVGLLYAAGFTAATTGFDTRLELAAYDRIHLTGNAQLLVVQEQANTSDANSAVTVTGPAENLRELVIESADGVLYIETGDDAHSADVMICATVRQLKELFLQGSSVVEADGLRGDSLIIESHGGGQFDLQHLHVGDLTVVGDGGSQFHVSGAVENQYVDLHGVGHYRAQGLASQTSQVSVRGSSRVELWVEELLDISVFGNAEVSYSGQPWVQQHMSGTGAIRRLSE